jgi:acetyl esterase/lipase
MTSKHLVDPELIGTLGRFAMPTVSAQTLPPIRAGLEQLNAMRPPPPADSDVALTERRIPGPVGAPEVRVLIYTPTGPADGLRPGYLDIHGGGYVIGMPEIDDISNRQLARSIGCVIVSVDYRLAPETPFPGPIEDCYAALTWFHSEAAILGVDSARIAVGGDSAGGGLAAALALLARDRAEVPIAFQSLIYPMIDDRTVTRSDPHPYTGEFIWTAESNRFAWTSLLGHAPGGDFVSAYAAAARAENLAGLPRAFIAVGALDLFLEEGIEYARRLTRAGVPTELHVYPGAYHGMKMAPDAHIVQAFERDCLDAARRALHPRPL